MQLLINSLWTLHFHLHVEMTSDLEWVNNHPQLGLGKPPCERSRGEKKEKLVLARANPSSHTRGALIVARAGVKGHLATFLSLVETYGNNAHLGPAPFLLWASTFSRV